MRYLTKLRIGGGYVGGPVIPATEHPWPILWEQDPRIDTCDHIWESCLLEADGKHRVRIDEVVRCMVCHAPRCGHALRDPDPCMERRHHRGEHRYLSGQTRKVGA